MTEYVITEHDKYTNKLFNDASFTLVTNNYKHIIDKDEFYTKLTGVIYDNRQETIKKLQPGQELVMVHDKGNLSHKNAILINTLDGENIGFLPKELADEMIKVLEEQNRLVFIDEITGNTEFDEFRGVNIVIQKIVPNRKPKIKGYSPTLKKEEMLDRIAEDMNILPFYNQKKEMIHKILRSGNIAIFGNDDFEKKQLIGLSSMYKILKYRQKILFLYNNKNAIMEDSKILNEIANTYEVNIQELNVEKLHNQTFSSYMETNNIDILITTYSYLDKVELDYEFGLVVHNYIDQNIRHMKVHQIKTLNTKSSLFNLGSFRKISTQNMEEHFGVKNFFEFQAEGNVKEVTLVDKRNIKEKDLFIQNFLIKGKRSLIYTNTRKNAVDIAKKIRSNLPRELKNRVIFYHGGLHIEDKKIIEDKFINNEYLFIVSTTAFDIAMNGNDTVDNIFIYNPPYTYNNLVSQVVQTAKYNKCTVYLIYSYTDVHRNKMRLSSNIVDKSDLSYVYRSLQYILYDKIREKFGYFNCKNHILREKIMEIFQKQYTNQRLETILKALDEMKVISFDKRSNDYFIEIYDFTEKANFEETPTYVNNSIMIHMFIEFELLLLDSIQKIHDSIFKFN